MDWNDVRHFLALARTGSVRAAGARLGVSHSTVARRVEALEQQLNARLFDRSRDGYALTDAGQQVLPGAERIEREMSAIERGVVGQDERLEGPVALTCCDTYVSALLIDGLVPFCEAHPGIALRLTADSRPFDLSRREADIALRVKGLDAQPPEHLIGQRSVPVVMASYVSVAHRARRDPEREGSHPRWLGFDDGPVQRQLLDQGSYPELPIWGAFASLELAVQATRAGMGIGMLPTYVGDTDPSLVRLDRPDLLHVAQMWILCHPDLRTNARFRAARHAVSQILTAHADLFAGHRPWRDTCAR